MSYVLPLQYAVLFMLGLFVLVHREWGPQNSGLEKDKLRPGNLSHAFQTEFSSILSNPTGFFVPFVWTFCRNVDRVFTFEKKSSFKNIFVRELG